MASRVRAARKSVEAAERRTKEMEEIGEIYDSKPDQGCCPPSFVEKVIAEARADEASAREGLEQVQGQQEQLREAVRGISQNYHPFDLQTGAVRDSMQVAADIEGHFATVEDLAEEVSLSQRCLDRIDKARRVVVRMVDTIAFFHETIRAWVEDLATSEETEQFILGRWIPGRYLELAAGRAQQAERRHELRRHAADVLPSSMEINDWLASFDEDERAQVEEVVEQCAQLFQRSSSGVEGRNGHLSLFHHGHHHLIGRKLAALTVVHNYVKVRPDGTTAAERFFGYAPRDLFEWLLERMPPPAWPSRSRRKAS